MRPPPPNPPNSNRIFPTVHCLRHRAASRAALAHTRALVSRQHSPAVHHGAQPPPNCFSQMQGATSAQPSMRLPPSAARDAAPGADLAHRGQNSTCSYAWMRCCSWPPWYFSIPFIRTKDRAFGGHRCGWCVAVIAPSVIGHSNVPHNSTSWTIPPTSAVFHRHV